MRKIKFEKLVPFFCVLIVTTVMLLSGYHATITGAVILGYTTIAVAFVVSFVSFIKSTEWTMIDAHHGFQAMANGWFIRSVSGEKQGEVTKYEVLPIGTLKVVILFAYFSTIRYFVRDPYIGWLFLFAMCITCYRAFSFSWALFFKKPYSEKLRPWKQ